MRSREACVELHGHDAFSTGKQDGGAVGGAGLRGRNQFHPQGLLGISRTSILKAALGIRLNFALWL